MLIFDANLSLLCCRCTPLISKKCLNDNFLWLVEHEW